MDERAQHGYPPPTHADAHGYEHPVAPSNAPWPSFQAPRYGAPVQGQAPFHHPQQQAPAPAPQFSQQQQPAPPQGGAMQYQYAPGFVLPGAPGHAPQPMSAQGGTIGVPMQHQHPHAQQQHPGMMPMLHGGHAHPQHAHVQHQQPQQPAHAPMHHGAAAMDPFAQPQAWAYPTPNGLQLVQPGAGAPQAQVAVAAQPRRGARRMKWETIVPGAAVACLIAAIALFISDFDRITGRDTLAKEAPAASTKQVDDTDTASGGGTAEDVDAVLGEANTLFEQGRFEDAANLLHPMLDVAAPDARVVKLHDRIDAAGDRNTALLAKLQRQRAAKQWPAMLGTIKQLEALRPLSPSLVKLRAEARRAIAARRAAQAAARQRAASPSNAGSRSGGSNPPAAGGNRTGGSTARPPATSPTAPATIPPRPDANPVANGGGGIGAAPTGSSGGTSGTSCHTHGGVTECH